MYKSISTLFILVFASAALADTSYYYELKPLGENIPRRFEEILIETGFTYQDIKHYSCNSATISDVFTDYHHGTNQAADSIKIISSVGTITYSGQNFEEFAEGSFERSAIKALNKIATTEVGAELIERLKIAPHTVYIKKGGNRFAPTFEGGKAYYGFNNATAIAALEEKAPWVERLVFDTVGIGGIVGWSPKKSKEDTTITLAHELFHAYDSVRGMLDQIHIHSDTIEFTAHSESRAVYLGNMIRKEWSIPYRDRYSPSTTSSKSLLDEQGEPIFLGNPCISGL